MEREAHRGHPAAKASSIREPWAGRRTCLRLTRACAASRLSARASSGTSLVTSLPEDCQTGPGSRTQRLLASGLAAPDDGFDRQRLALAARGNHLGRAGEMHWQHLMLGLAMSELRIGRVGGFSLAASGHTRSCRSKGTEPELYRYSDRAFLKQACKVSG